MFYGRKIKILAALLIFGIIWSCGEKKSQETENVLSKEATQKPIIIPATADSTASGLKYVELKTGSGVQPQSGQSVLVHYTGWLLNGKKFDSSLDRGTPLEFKIGVGQVIPGWDEGVGSMKVGGKRRLFVPPQLGYGERGYPPVIPPKATLVFDVELLEVK